MTEFDFMGGLCACTFEVSADGGDVVARSMDAPVSGIGGDREEALSDLKYALEVYFRV